MDKVIVRDLVIDRETFQLGECGFQLAPGEVLGVMGKSGSGKTSLLLALGGFIPLSRGNIVVEGRELKHVRPERRRISMVFQKPWIFENMNVIENVEFGLKIQGKTSREARENALNWLNKLEIGDLAQRKAWEVSGGQAQRVVIARALAVGFPLTLLDEPFSALDGTLRRELRKNIRQLILESGNCAVFVSHQWKDIKETADKVLILRSGKPIFYGRVSDIDQSTDPFVREVSLDD